MTIELSKEQSGALSTQVHNLALAIVKNGTSNEASGGIPIAAMVNTLALLVQMQTLLSNAVLDSMMKWANHLKELEVAGRTMS